MISTKRAMTKTGPHYGEEKGKSLVEISVEYRENASKLADRVALLEQEQGNSVDSVERCKMAERLRILRTMLRETRELAVLTERYYERGYRRNVKYTL